VNLDRGAVQANGLDLYSDHLLHLQLLKHPVQNTCLRPSIHPRVNRMPISELLWQAAPLAAMLGNMQDSVHDSKVINADVAPLYRQQMLDDLKLSFRYFHPLNIHG
jgi:hypothetical protein